MIKEAFCSFEVSKLLREKGFVQETLMVYNQNGNFMPNGAIEDTYQIFLSAPTHQMAMAWLREVHNIHTEICLYKTSEDDIEPKKSRKAPYYTFGVWNAVTGDNIDKRLTNDFIGDTYEDAVEAALKYCLENLI